MENEKQVNPKKKMVITAIAVVIILAAVIAIIVSMPKGEKTPEGSRVTTPGQEDVSPNLGPDGEEISPEDMEAIEMEDANPVLVGAITQAPGADLITTEGKVVNQEGKEVRTDVPYNSPEAPKQTLSLQEEDIPEAIKLSIDENGFNPSSFSVEAGQAITLALTGLTSSSHVLTFENPELSAVFINIRPGETRATTFNAPSEPGDYTYYCGFPGHKNRGEIGTMTVN